MKVKTIRLLTNIYMLTKSWNEGAIKEEKDFLIPLREAVQELCGELENEGLDVSDDESAAGS